MPDNCQVTGVSEGLLFLFQVPPALMEAYESAWKAHLGPAPPWKAYIEKTRHEDMERLKTAMHGGLEAFSHQAGNFITRSHSEFIRQQ